jgi:hypothetical protein
MPIPEFKIPESTSRPGSKKVALHLILWRNTNKAQARLMLSLYYAWGDTSRSRVITLHGLWLLRMTGILQQKSRKGGSVVASSHRKGPNGMHRNVETKLPGKARQLI